MQTVGQQLDPIPLTDGVGRILDFLVGRSGILRPSLSYEYTTHDAMGSVDANGNSNVTLVAISSTLRFNIGYSTMW